MNDPHVYTRASGIIMLTLPDGKIINMRVDQVDVQLDTETDEYQIHNFDGTISVHTSNANTSVTLHGHVQGATVTDPKPAD